MRILEIIITGIILIVLVVRLVPNLKKKTVFSYVVFAAGVLIPIHLVVDGYRWQMIPVYIFTLVLILVRVIQFFSDQRRNSLSVTK